jgi:hypothetical protein
MLPSVVALVEVVVEAVELGVGAAIGSVFLLLFLKRQTVNFLA